MEVTEVKVFSAEEEKLKAYVTITLDDCFVVRVLKFIGGTSGLVVSMPSKRRRDGIYRDVAHPLNSETRRMIEGRIIATYWEVTTRDIGQDRET